MEIFKTFDSTQHIGWTENYNRIPPSKKDIYCSLQYNLLYEMNGDGKVKCFFYEKNGEFLLYPVLKNSINKLGYDLDKEYFDIQGAYGYNGLITSSLNKDFINSFYKYFNEYCFYNNIVAEFTRFNPVLENEKISNNYMDVLFDRQTIILDLNCDYEDLWANQYSSVNRNMIRKAKKNNIDIYFINDEKSILDFAALYRSTMNNLNAKDYYYFDDNYFKNLRNRLENNYELVLAYFDGNLIAGSLFLYSDYYYHYHLSARNPEFNSLAANNLILDFALKSAKEKGSKRFHFGGGTTDSSDDTLLKFKRNFSKQTACFYIGKKIHNNEVYSKVVSMWKKERYKAENEKILLKYRF